MEIKLANGQIVVPSMDKIILIERILFPNPTVQNINDELRRIFDTVQVYIGEPLNTRNKCGIVVYGRQLYCYVARHLTSASFKQIASLIGNRHHTSILYAVNKFRDLHHTELLVQKDLLKIYSTLENNETIKPKEKKVPIVKIIIPAIPPKPKEKFIRPKAEYTNTTPYGVAKELNM